MNIEQEVLKAAAELEPSKAWKAEELHGQLTRLNLNLEEVSLALLHLRDDGLVVTEPTVGDPLDGHFCFRLTSEGLQTAAQI